MITAIACFALVVVATPVDGPAGGDHAIGHGPGPGALTIDDAIALALANDPRVDGAAVAVERARLRRRRAELERLRASVDLNVQTLYVSPRFFSATTGGPLGAILPLGTLQGSFAAPLLSGGRVESAIEEADALEAASVADVEAERAAVALAAARAWWSVRRLALLEDALLASDMRLEESERLVKARVTAGLAPGLDENRAAARRVQLDVERQGLQAQRREAGVQLALVLGVATPVTLRDGGADAACAADRPGGTPCPVPTQDIEAAVARAFERRPELRGTELRLRALAAERKATESDWWPQLDAVGLVQLGNNPALPGADARGVSAALVDGDVQAGLVFKWNLFDTWATATAVDDVGHRQRIAAAERRAQRNEVENAVRLAFARLTSLQEQRAVLGRARAILDDNLANLDRAWQRGEVLFTEVLDAQVEIAGNDRQLIDVDAQLSLARLELQAAVDGVVTAAAPAAAAPPSASSSNASSTGTTVKGSP